MSTLRDADLVARCRDGDAEAWRTLVERFSRYVYAIAVQVYRLSDDRAEDVFQEVFARAYEHLGELRDDRALRPWIGQLTRRLCVDRLRSNSRELVREDLDSGIPFAAGDALAQIDEALTVRQAIGRLPMIQREIVERALVRGESHAAIASALGIAEGTVASRISRARQRLRALLSERES
jgi:RNA polymerase sigma-70 factor (ECF subfamily)